MEHLYAITEKTTSSFFAFQGFFVFPGCKPFLQILLIISKWNHFGHGVTINKKV